MATLQTLFHNKMPLSNVIRTLKVIFIARYAFYNQFGKLAKFIYRSRTIEIHILNLQKLIFLRILSYIIKVVYCFSVTFFYTLAQKAETFLAIIGQQANF